MALPRLHTVVRLMRRPQGMVVPGVDLVASLEPTPSSDDMPPDTVLVHRLYLSLDPAMRGWMKDLPSYIPPVKLNDTMRGFTVNEVVASTSDSYKVGDIVADRSINGGWEEFKRLDERKCSKLPELSRGVPITAHLGVLGITGMTAYFGLLDVGKPKAGETVLVSAAAGATGSVVCQIAKHVMGCKVVGIAGGAKKCDWLLKEVGCDAVIDYKESGDSPRKFHKQLRHALKQIDSKGFDIFFDNVGGYILNEALLCLNVYGRVVLCGAISGYNAQTAKEIVAPTNYMTLISQRAKIQGFIVTDYAKQFKEAKQKMAEWLSEGKLVFKEDIRQGLDKAPEYLNELFRGGNIGKLIVQVGQPMTGTSPAESRL